MVTAREVTPIGAAQRTHRQDGRTGIANLGAFLEASIPKPKMLVEGVLPGGSTMLLAGQHKVGKTFALVQLAMAVACGKPWLWWPTQEAPVLYLNHEVAAWSFQQRLQRAENGFLALVDGDRKMRAALRSNLFVASLPNRRIDRPADLKALAGEVVQRHVALVIVDPIRGAFTGDGNDDQKVNVVMQGILEEVVAATGAAVVLGHHVRKPAPGTSDDGSTWSVKGSSAWADASDAIGTLRFEPRNTLGRLLNLRLRHFESVDDVQIRFRPASALFTPSGEHPDLTAHILSTAFREAPGGELATPALADLLGVDRTTFKRRWNAGDFPGVVKVRTGDKGVEIFTWRVA